jgi:hypothetical protein
MTVMTLMTAICGGFLGVGVHLPFAGWLPTSSTSSPFPLLYRDVGMVMMGFALKVFNG